MRVETESGIEGGSRAATAAAARFTDAHRRLSLFAEGLAGRFLHLKEHEDAGCFARADRIGAGDSIFLPAEIADFPVREQNHGAYRIAVLHQIGYQIEGTLEFDLEAFLAGSPKPALLRRVFMTVEDLRIDSAIRRRYPGACADLERVLAHALANRPRAAVLQPLPALLEALLQFSLGAPPAPLIAEDASGLLHRVIDAARIVQREHAEVRDSARASMRICVELESVLLSGPRASPPTTAAKAPADPASGDASARAPAATSVPFAEAPDDANPGIEFRGALRPDQIFKRRRGPRMASRAADSEAAGFTIDEPREPADGMAAPSARSRLTMQRAAQQASRSFLYDEWDYTAQSYLPGWCRVFEHRLRGEDFGFIDGVRRRHAALASRVRRQFGFIKPQSWHRVRRTSDGDELELDGVIEAVVDRRSGHATDSHLYVRRDRALRDVAAAFLVDMSASTDYPLPEDATAAPARAAEPRPEAGPYLWAAQHEAPAAPAPARRRVIDVSKDALALMCDALHRLGDSYAIYGFSGDGRDNVEFHVAKDFADKLSARTWAALAAMQPRRSTRMGAAIRHALCKLAREAAAVKVLIIVSDGYPEDHDYGPDRTDREYGIEDTARALREAELAGVTDFCVTIDPAGHDYLRRMCREARYLVIDDVSALPRELSKIYRTLTTQA